MASRADLKCDNNRVQVLPGNFVKLVASPFNLAISETMGLWQKLVQRTSYLSDVATDLEVFMQYTSHFD